MYRIEPICAEDDEKIATIVRGNLEHYGLDIPGTAYFDPELDHLSGFYNNLPDSRIYFILKDPQGQVAGGIGLAEFPHFDRCAEIQKLYLTDREKGKGLGRLLLERAEKQAVEMGYRRLYLETHSNLKEAIVLYEKMGYKLLPKPDFVVHTTMNQFYMKELPES